MQPVLLLLEHGLARLSLLSLLRVLGVFGVLTVSLPLSLLLPLSLFLVGVKGEPQDLLVELEEIVWSGFSSHLFVIDEGLIQLPITLLLSLVGGGLVVFQNIPRVLDVEICLFLLFVVVNGREVQGEGILELGNGVLLDHVLIDLVVIDLVRPDCLRVVEEVDEVDGVGQECHIPTLLPPPPPCYPLFLQELQLLQLLLLQQEPGFLVGLLDDPGLELVPVHLVHP